MTSTTRISRLGIKKLVEREVAAILAADDNAMKMPAAARAALATTIGTRVASMLEGIARPVDNAIVGLRQQ